MPNIVKVPVFTIDELAPEVRESVIDRIYNGESPFDMFVAPDWYEALKEFGEDCPIEEKDSFDYRFKFDYPCPVVKEGCEAVAKLEGEAAHKYLKDHGFIKRVEVAKKGDDTPTRLLCAPLNELLKDEPTDLPSLEIIFGRCIDNWAAGLKNACEEAHTEENIMRELREEDSLYTKNGHNVSCYRESLTDEAKVVNILKRVYKNLRAHSVGDDMNGITNEVLEAIYVLGSK